MLLKYCFCGNRLVKERLVLVVFRYSLVRIVGFTQIGRLFYIKGDY